MYFALPALNKWPGIVLSLLSVTFAVVVLLAGFRVVRSATATTPCTAASTSQSCQVATLNGMMNQP